MNFILQPWQLLLAILASWVHHEQQKVIEFYQIQRKAVLDTQGKKRLLLSDEHRRLPAVKGKSLGRKALMELTTIVTPDTILRWHRQLVAQKWDTSDKRKAGRPRVRQVIVDLVVKFAKENPTWSYDRVQGALANVGYHISDTTVGNILMQHGIEPAPDRKRQTACSTFLKAHWDATVLPPRRSVNRAIFQRWNSATRARRRCRNHQQSPDSIASVIESGVISARIRLPNLC